MHDSIHTLPMTMEALGVTLREAEWGDMNVAFETFPAGMDSAPVFKGLPDDRCQCPHWGYIIEGQFTITYRDREEVVNAGDLYYLAPGHTTRFGADTRLVELSPKGEYQKTLEVAAQNVAALMSNAGR